MEEVKSNELDKTKNSNFGKKFTGEADILTRATVGDARIYVARTTRLVRKLSLRHNLSHLATAALGRTVTGALLLAATMKNEEGVGIDSVLGHGGIFKTEGVAQSILASAINADVSVMEGAGEGGPWGMALLAAYMNQKDEDEKLSNFLNNKVFANARKSTLAPKPVDVKGFEEFAKRYADCIEIEKKAIECLN